MSHCCGFHWCLRYYRLALANDLDFTAAREHLEWTLREIKCVPLYDPEPVPTPFVGQILRESAMNRHIRSLIDFGFCPSATPSPRPTHDPTGENPFCRNLFQGVAIAFFLTQSSVRFYLISCLYGTHFFDPSIPRLCFSFRMYISRAHGVPYPSFYISASIISAHVQSFNKRFSAVVCILIDGFL